MARVVSIFLPQLPTDRIRRLDPSIPADQPLVMIAKSGAKRWIAALDTVAVKAGLRLGMPAAKAQALVAGLHMVDADPAADAKALIQYSPVVAVDPPDGIVMDTEGQMSDCKGAAERTDAFPNP